MQQSHDVTDLRSPRISPPLCEVTISGALKVCLAQVWALGSGGGNSHFLLICCSFCFDWEKSGKTVTLLQLQSSRILAKLQQMKEWRHWSGDVTPALSRQQLMPLSLYARPLCYVTSRDENKICYVRQTDRAVTVASNYVMTYSRIQDKNAPVCFCMTSRSSGARSRAMTAFTTLDKLTFSQKK